MDQWIWAPLGPADTGHPVNVLLRADQGHWVHPVTDQIFYVDVAAEQGAFRSFYMWVPLVEEAHVVLCPTAEAISIEILSLDCSALPNSAPDSVARLSVSPAPDSHRFWQWTNPL